MLTDGKQAVATYSTRVLGSSCGVMERRFQTLITGSLGLLALLRHAVHGLLQLS